MRSGREQLADWIGRREVNQREAAQLLDMDFTVLNQILRGRRNPGLHTAVQIARVSGIPVEAWSPTNGGKSAERESVAGRKRRVGKA